MNSIRNRITTEHLTPVKSELPAWVAGFQSGVDDCLYADIRMEVDQYLACTAEDGKLKRAVADGDFRLGIRVIAGGEMPSPGYYGSAIGLSELDRIGQIVKDGFSVAYRRALSNSLGKQRFQNRFPRFGESLFRAKLASIPVSIDDYESPYRIDPRGVPLDKVISLSKETSLLFQTDLKGIVYNYTAVICDYTRRLFANSEGTLVDESHPITEAVFYVVASGENGTHERFETLGNQSGLEALTEGENVYGKTLRDFARWMGQETIDLANAPHLPNDIGEAVVITDPSYNALLVHEIVGHPTEADRVLKMETAYAGRTWFYDSHEKNQMGSRVASELVTAYSDPSFPGYGHYRYDHEGTPGRKVVHIDRGIFTGFMNSRQTAGILDLEPNGHFTATAADMVPLIRMSTTVFACGESDPDDMIREVPDGYYLVGARIPSIAERRENFRITATKTYRIEKGEITTLYQNGGISADTKSFLTHVDAVGNDFKIYPIPNCGKGQPMQAKRLGNGGPTLRSRAGMTGGSR